MPIDTTDLLRELGPGLTTRHSAELVATGISETAARKRVQRASGLVTVSFRVLEWNNSHQGEQLWHANTMMNYPRSLERFLQAT